MEPTRTPEDPELLVPGDFEPESPPETVAPEPPSGVLVVAERPMRTRAGIWLGLVAILACAAVFTMRSGAGDWKGLGHELAAWANSIAKRGPSAKTDTPTPAQRPTPAPAHKAPDLALAPSPPAHVAPQVENPPDQATQANEVAANVPKPQATTEQAEPDPTQSAMSEIEREAAAKNEELAALDKLKENEAKELAKNPPRRTARHPWGIPDAAEREAFMRERMAEARRQMNEMMRDQSRFIEESERAFADMRSRMLRDLPGAAEPGALALPFPDLFGPPRGDLGREVDDAFRMLRELERQLGPADEEQNPRTPGHPRVRRWERRGPNGSWQRFEIRFGNGT
jgi:type IV secretory pathway VirB10-like protein